MREAGKEGWLARCCRDAGRGLLGLFYPQHCAACGVALAEEDPLAEMHDSLCGTCLSGIRPISGHCCPVCSHSLAGPVPCPNCYGREWHLTTIVAPFRYEGVVRELIQRFKYGGDSVLARPLGTLLAKGFSDSRIYGKAFDALVPVPLHSLREREREFNQSRILAGRLSGATGYPMSDLLRRVRATSPQAGFDRERRMENLRGAFALGRSFPEGSSLLLVDDVATTGATLDACAEILMDKGAAEVFALVVARG